MAQKRERTALDYMRHDRLIVHIEWQQEIHPDSDQARTTEVAARECNAHYIDREPDRFFGECLGRTVGAIQFARPLQVWASALLEVMDWELLGQSAIDPGPMQRLHAACQEIQRAYEDLDREFSE